jgi:hypothetical protein
MIKSMGPASGNGEHSAPARKIKPAAALAFAALLAWSLDVRAAPVFPTGVLNYVPITLTNNQTTVVSSGTPVQLNVNWNSYGALLPSAVTNVVFLDSRAAQIPAWIESCAGSYTSCPSTTASSVVWVTVDSAIPASGGTSTLYMGFYSTGKVTLSSAGLMGASPMLTGTYGQYDNGSRVFNAYFNGVTSTTTLNLGSNNVAVSSAGVPFGSSTMTALYLTGYDTYRVNIIVPHPLPNVPMLAESSFMTQNNTSGQGVASFCDQALPSSYSTTAGNGISTVVGFYASLFSQLYITNGNITTDQNQQGAAAVLGQWYYGAAFYEGPSVTDYASYISSTSLYAAYMATDAVNPLSAASNLYLCIIGSENNVGYKDLTYFNWTRARLNPPNSTMPSVAFGPVTCAVITPQFFLLFQ